MDWIKENKFLSGFIAVFAVGVAVLGFLLISGYGDFKESLRTYEDTAKKVNQLETKELYPNERNLTKIEDLAAEYESKVDSLHSALVGYQPALVEDMTDRQFQDKLTNEVLAIKGDAVRQGVEIFDGFALGMGTYTGALPSRQAVPMLNFELDAMAFVMRALLEEDVTSIESIDREILPVEGGTAAAPAPGDDEADADADDGAAPPSRAAAALAAAGDVIDRLPIKVCFTGSPQTLEGFLNALGNTKPGTFVFNVRYLTVDSEKLTGPEREAFEARVLQDLAEEEAALEPDEEIAPPDETDPDAPAEDPLDDPADPGDPAEEEEVPAFLTPSEPRTAQIDAQIIMGNEDLRVCATIDIIRYHTFAKGDDPAEAGDDPAPPAN